MYNYYTKEDNGQIYIYETFNINLKELSENGSKDIQELLLDMPLSCDIDYYIIFIEFINKNDIYGRAKMVNLVSESNNNPLYPTVKSIYKIVDLYSACYILNDVNDDLHDKKLDLNSGKSVQLLYDDYLLFIVKQFGARLQK